jgi:serine/threonine protein kinase
MANTCPSLCDWQALLDDAEPEQNQADLCRHLETCAVCQRTLDLLVAEPVAWNEACQGLGPDSRAAAQEPDLRQAMERLKEQGSPPMTEPEPTPDERLSFLRPADRPGLLGRLGGYEVQEVIGRGGMGIVLKAFDPGLNRLVAIKVLAPHLASNGTARQRFVREARATAAVTHENVIAIHAVDEADGLPYLVMQYIDGPSLQQKLDQTGPLLVPEILRIGLQTAAGLGAAHAQGLIHRDVKPANILLENGIERVKLTDFGLARAVDGTGLSREGVVSGTPEYMAPEQARGEPLGPRADLFSLGSVLYALCTGLPPFHGGPPLAVLRKVSDEAAAPIWSINPEVPEWLEAIVRRLLAKDPAGRFATAAEVADLLQQHLARLQQPVAVSSRPADDRLECRLQPARTGTRTPRFRRWLIAAAVLLTVTLSVTEATGLTGLLGAAGTILRYQTPEGTLVVEVDDPQIRVDIDGQDMVFTGTGAREVRLHPGTHRLRATRDGVPFHDEIVTITRDGREVVRVRRETAAQAPLPAAVPRKAAAPPFKLPPVPRPTEGRIIEQPAAVWGLPHNPACGVFSPDGKTLATGMWDGTAILWDFATGRPRTVLRTGASSSRATAISPDSQTVATGSADGVVRLWDAHSGQLRQELTGHHAPVQAVTFSPDGKVLASGSWDHTVRLWDLPSGKPHILVPAFKEQVWSISYAPDGRSVAVAVGRAEPGRPGWVEVVATADAKTLQSQQLPAYVRRVAFSPDGQQLAVGYGEDGQVEIRSSAAGGKALASFRASSKPLQTLTYTPNGNHLLVAGSEGTAILWDPAGKQPRRLATFLGHTCYIYFAAISPDGRTLATGAGNPDRTIRLWDIAP